MKNKLLFLLLLFFSFLPFTLKAQGHEGVPRYERDRDMMEIPDKFSLIHLFNTNNTKIIYAISSDGTNWTNTAVEGLSSIEYTFKENFFIKIGTGTIIISYRLIPNKYYFIKWNDDKNALDIYEQTKD